MLKNKKKLLLIILLISAFFRFYKPFELQYWSGDEELVYMIERKMLVEKRPVLISPNSQISSSLGSYYHLLSLPLFALARGRVELVLLAGSLLGVITTYIMYLAGKELGGKRVGLIAALLYGASTLAALSDRRWWPLSVDPFLAVLAYLSLSRFIKGKTSALILLMLPIGFAFHADPSILALVAGILLTWIIFRIPIWRKSYLPAMIVLGVFFLPLVLFEYRHPGAIFKPLFNFIQSPFLKQEKGLTFNLERIDNHLVAFTRALLLRPSNNIEKTFYYELVDSSPLGYPLSPALIGAFLIVTLGTIVKEKKSRKNILPAWLLLGGFLIGGEIYIATFKMQALYQHYYVIIIPIVMLLVAGGLERIIFRKNVFLGLVILAIYLSLNVHTLVTSKMKYPMSDKVQLTKKVSEIIQDKTYSVTATEEGYVYGGGMTALLIDDLGKPPVHSYIYDPWDWIYRSHGLFPIDAPKLPAELRVHFSTIESDGDEMIDDQGIKLNEYQSGKLKATIFSF